MFDDKSILITGGTGSFGKKFIKFGEAASRIYGKEKPIPINKKTKKIIKKFCAKAKEIAEPKNGAEHGVASITAKTPDKKFVIKTLFSALFCAIFWLKKLAKNWLKVISKTPNKSAAKKVSVIIRKIKK